MCTKINKQSSHHKRYLSKRSPSRSPLAINNWVLKRLSKIILHVDKQLDYLTNSPNNCLPGGGLGGQLGCVWRTAPCTREKTRTNKSAAQSHPARSPMGRIQAEVLPPKTPFTTHSASHSYHEAYLIHPEKMDMRMQPDKF